MQVYSLIKCSCSDLGFSKVKMIGTFVEKSDAEKLKKELIEKENEDFGSRTTENYKFHILESTIIYPIKQNIEIPESIKLGYDIA